MMKLLLAVFATLMFHAAWAADKPPAPQRASIEGVALEVKDADPYTYLRLKTKEGELWAAVTKATVKKGDKVTIENAVVMNNFESKTLKKTFDRIAFGTLAGSGAASPGTDLSQFHRPPPQARDIGDVKVPKASGPEARTVAEIAGKPAALNGKPVVVRGKVVKFTASIMGKNWIHLQDGSGSAADNTNDLVVTTKDQTQVGSIVVARGIVRTDVNLGPGYSYKVLVEDATLQK